MEPRRVVIVAEVLSDLPVAKIRKAAGLSLYIVDDDGLTCCHALPFEQLQVNVVEAPKKKANRKSK